MQSTIRPFRTRQQGLTLVELMVSVVLALLVTLAASGALLASRQGFASVDASSQLRDNARFTTQLIKRVVEQAGYEDHNAVNAVTNANASRWSGVTPDPFIAGLDDQDVRVPSTGPSYTAGGINNSDVLIVRYQGSSAAKVGAATPNAADGSIIDCAGYPRGKTTDLSKLAQSIFYVKESSGEPTLMCGYRDDDGTWSSAPLISGVENLQIRYGVSTATPAPNTNGTDLPEKYVKASELGDPALAANTPNWQRVKAIRIGLVLRGMPGSALDRGDNAKQVLYPLGDTKETVDETDKDASFVPPADGRLRQVVTFTVYLRNPQSW